MSYQPLIASLSKLSIFMNKYGLTDYGKKYSEVAVSLQLSPGNKVLLEFANSPYVGGAMGSINDVIICKGNGHFVSEKDEDSVNEELEKLVNKMRFELAKIINS